MLQPSPSPCADIFAGHRKKREEQTAVNIDATFYRHDIYRQDETRFLARGFEEPRAAPSLRISFSHFNATPSRVVRQSPRPRLFTPDAYYEPL